MIGQLLEGLKWAGAADFLEMALTHHCRAGEANREMGQKSCCDSKDVEERQKLGVLQGQGGLN